MRKYSLLAIALIVIFTACKKDKIDEVPSGVIRTKADSTLYPKIVQLFPEHKRAAASFPYLFSDTVEKRIALTEETEVYITFIEENATSKNSLGWYSYLEGQEPQSVNNIEKHLLFPNVSGKGEGGELEQGFMLQVGDKKFPKGTVIGFFLVLNGWNNGSVDYSLDTHYTDKSLNINGLQFSILFQEEKSGDIVLGFEDLPEDNRDVDYDYNDVLFTIHDNKSGYKTIYLNTDKIPKI